MSASFASQLDTAVPKCPFISLHAKDEEVKAGEKVELKCIAGGTPYPRLQWYCNGKIVVGSRTSIVQDSVESVLTLNGKQTSSTAIYECRVTNCWGSAKSQATITVNGTYKFG